MDWDIFWTNKEWIRAIYDKIHLVSPQPGQAIPSAMPGAAARFRRNFLPAHDAHVLLHCACLLFLLLFPGRTPARESLPQLLRADSQGPVGEEPEARQAQPEPQGARGGVRPVRLLPRHILPPCGVLAVRGGIQESTGTQLDHETGQQPSGTWRAAAAFGSSAQTQCRRSRSSVFACPLSVYVQIGSSQGKGIFLFERLSQISDWKTDHASRFRSEDPKDKDAAEKYIVQRYLSDPLLIGGKKFDLRIYVLVTNYQPLTCYMYREGFARFSSTRFTMVKGEITNNCQ